MNKAGRIGFVIRGDYSATEPYDFLDVVYYNGASYVAKKLTTGNTPQRDDDYWHILVDSNSAYISDETPTFTESTTRANINSNEKISILFGKIKKWYTDLKAVAFSGSYNDLSDTPSIPAAVAVKGDLETNYRTGNVNLTKANIGLGNVPNVATNDQTPTYTQATTRANLTSGEKLSISLGKIMKFFADLKTVAFSGSYNDLSNKPSIPAAVAVKGNAESSYRTGNVNLTPANIGAVPTANVLDSKESITANTASGNVAGALGTKEINANLQSQIDTLNSNLNNIFIKPTDSWWSSLYGSNDANSILDTGIGLTTSGFANVPDDGWGTLVSFVLSESYRIQIIHTWNYNKIYIRACCGESWTDWKQIGTSI